MNTSSELPEGFYWAQWAEGGDWTVAEQQDGRLFVVGVEDRCQPSEFAQLVPIPPMVAP